MEDMAFVNVFQSDDPEEWSPPSSAGVDLSDLAQASEEQQWWRTVARKTTR